MHYSHDTSGRGGYRRRLFELIRARAYQKFEARGGEPHRALDDWLSAEREITQQWRSGTTSETIAVIALTR